MAKSVARRWDPDYCDEGLDFVYNYEALRDKLLDNMQSLSKELELTDTFWDLLLQREVVNEKIQNQIQAKWTKRMQAMTLVHHVMEVKVYKFHGFIWALVNSNQSHLAEQLGFDSCDYLDMEVFMKSSSFRCPACHEFYTKAFILTACGHYVCGPCVKGAQFFQKDDKKEDIMCPVPECNKLSEASPSEGNIGLNEDEAFKDLGEAVMKEMTEREEPEVQTVDDKKRSKRQLKTFEDRSGQLKKTVSSLQKYRDVLGRNKAGVQNYIQEEVRKVQQSADEWARGNLGQYQNMCQQVENHLQKYRQWQKAAAEVSVLSRARPGWLEECLKDKFNLPQETLMDAAEKLVTKLDAGMALPLLYTPCGTSVPPAQGKFLTSWKLPEDEDCYKLAWLSGDLLILTEYDLWRMDIDGATSECEATLIPELSGASDMSVAADGTLALVCGDVIEIHYPNQKVKHWTPDSEYGPDRVFINNKNIFFSERYSGPIKSYCRELMYVDQYEMEDDDLNYFIHVTDKGKLMRNSLTDYTMHTIDLETKERSTFGREDKKGEKLSLLEGMCTVTDDEYVLACNIGHSPVCVFTHDGQFIHYLDVERDPHGVSPNSIAVLSQSGRPTLMALGGGDFCGVSAVSVYTLE